MQRTHRPGAAHALLESPLQSQRSKGRTHGGKAGTLGCANEQLTEKQLYQEQAYPLWAVGLGQNVSAEHYAGREPGELHLCASWWENREGLSPESLSVEGDMKLYCNNMEKVVKHTISNKKSPESLDLACHRTAEATLRPITELPEKATLRLSENSRGSDMERLTHTEQAT